MKKNESKTDQTIRIILGTAILVIGLVAGSWWALIGLIPLLTGLVGYCPLYALVGFSTRQSSASGFQPGGGRL